MLDPRSSQLGSTTDQKETQQKNDQGLHQAPTQARCDTCTGITGICNCFEVSMSHKDSTISHPRDQDYLSLWVGSGKVVRLQQ